MDLCIFIFVVWHGRQRSPARVVTFKKPTMSSSSALKLLVPVYRALFPFEIQAVAAHVVGYMLCPRMFTVCNYERHADVYWGTPAPGADRVYFTCVIGKRGECFPSVMCLSASEHAEEIEAQGLPKELPHYRILHIGTCLADGELLYATDNQLHRAGCASPWWKSKLSSILPLFAVRHREIFTAGYGELLWLSSSDHEIYSFKAPFRLYMIEAHPTRQELYLASLTQVAVVDLKKLTTLPRVADNVSDCILRFIKLPGAPSAVCFFGGWALYIFCSLALLYVDGNEESGPVCQLTLTPDKARKNSWDLHNACVTQRRLWLFGESLIVNLHVCTDGTDCDVYGADGMEPWTTDPEVKASIFIPPSKPDDREGTKKSSNDTSKQCVDLPGCIREDFTQDDRKINSTI